MGTIRTRCPRRSEVVEQTIDALLGALIAVEQARDALENVRGRFGSNQKDQARRKRLRQACGAGNCGPGITHDQCARFLAASKKSQRRNRPHHSGTGRRCRRSYPSRNRGDAAWSSKCGRCPPQGSNHLRVRNAPRGAGLRLRHHQPPEKNHRWARSDPEDGNKGQLCSNLLPTPQPEA